MAELVCALGVPHTPMLWHLLENDVPPDLTGVALGFDRARAVLSEAEPDVIVMVASDHFHEFNHANMATFSVGKADHIDGTHRNEERSFGLPTVEMPGHPGLAEAIIGRENLAGGFDFSYSNNPHLDHAYVVPLLFLRPEMDIPVVPIHTNTNAPPIPTVKRFVELGRHIRAVLDRYDQGLRVAVIASGHLAYDLGGPNLFLGRSTDPEFDAMATDWIRRGDLDEAEAACTFTRLTEAGNLTFQFLNFLTLAAIAGRPADHAEGVACRFGHEPFYTWGVA